MRLKILALAVLLSFLFIPACLQAQLKPGFDKWEYKQMLLISTRTSASKEYYSKFPAPEKFRMIYQSPVMGLDNLWDLWLDSNSVAVISIRGTTGSMSSWLANFYAAMVPAKGQLLLSARDTFRYELASNPRAAVHVGWLLAMAFLSRDMMPRIDSLYDKGIRDFIVTGHSQGGAISYLLTAYLRQLQKQQRLRPDIRIKTYCSAAPKPGNLYFAYDYEVMTHGGWAFNAVNTADWVPESPYSVQTSNDYNAVNPFTDAKKWIKKMKFPTNIAFKHVYNSLDKPTKKAQRHFQKYLGKTASKYVNKALPEFIPPTYYPSNDYVRTGTTVVLQADDEYYKIFPGENKSIFAHHMHRAYLYLLDKYNP